MTDAHTDSDPLAALVVRRGHFVLESGLHADRWIELDALLVEPSALAPCIDALATLLAPYRFTAVCGPLNGGAFVAHAVAIRMGSRFYFTEPVDTAGTAPGTNALFAARYALPAGLRARASLERFAIVDDVVSAGSSVRATIDALTATGASIAVVAAPMVLGDRAVEHFATVGLSLVSTRFEPFDSWEPGHCPLCADGVPLDSPI